MKSIARMSMEEVGAYVCSELEKHDIHVVLSGGSCAQIYSDGKYTSLDIDLVNRYNERRGKITKVMNSLGFVEEHKYFIYPETDFYIEFPPGPLGVGDAPVNVIAQMIFDTGTLRLLSATDCIKDRLAAYYHWNDAQCLEQAVWVAQKNDFDMNEIEEWSKIEKSLEKFHIFKERV